jgi:hypothetical protein
MCLAAAISAFIIWILGFQQTGGFSMIIIAVLIFAVLMFIDGYRSST